MPLKSDKTVRVVLYEGTGARTLDQDRSYSAMKSLLEKGFAVTRLRENGRVATSDRHSTLVVGEFEPGAAPENDGWTIQNLDSMDEAALGSAVEAFRDETQSARHGEWKPWFPVIDYDRCTNCMQCLSFCLFGVYGVDDQQRIEVQTQDNCKTNCPACSRVCPEAAIMFPKYKSGPINGDLVSQADLEREKMKIDISALLGGDVYQMLRERSERAKSRFSKERDANKALQERQRCLTKLAQAGDIPAEVLMALPSPEEIARRAEEAKVKAQAALDAQPGQGGGL